MLLTALASLCLTLPVPAEDPREACRLLDLQGRSVGWTELARARWTVLAYDGVGCPLSARWTPRLLAIAETYRARGVRFYGINANPQDTRAAVAKEAAELGIDFPVYKDARQDLTRALGARTTTEVFVLDAEGRVHYHGAIDDQHGLDGSRPEPSANYLSDALDALLDGREPSVASSEAPGCKITLLAEGEAPVGPTWSEDVAPIVRERCTGCHQEGGGAPFSLESYRQAKGWSAMMADVLAERRMPPWTADERFAGHFKNERRLDAWERAVLERWLASGSPEGEDGVEAKSPRYGDGWRLGVPDVEYAVEQHLRWSGAELVEEELPPEGYPVPRQGEIEYQYFSVQTDFPSEQWIRAIEIRPGARDVVHHVLVWAEDPERPGNWRSDGAFRNYFAATVPGDFPTVFGPGLAKRMPAGARLVFQIHYTANGKERHDRTRIALYLSEEEHPREVLTGAVINTRFRIPPGAADHEVTGKERLDQGIELLSLLPHMHLRGQDFRYQAVLPDGQHLDLYEGRFDFGWQDSYVWREPVRLPRGSVLECVGHYDNSAANRANPDPQREVRWGDQTWEEMFIGYYDYIVATSDG